MSKKEETINLGSGMNVSSIQITINLGQPVGEPKAQSTGTDISADEPPAGTLVRQVFPDPLNPSDAQKKVRITFVPDSSEQGSSTTITGWDLGDRDNWSKLLGRPADVDIDTGITLVRFNITGGVATWLPDDPNGNIINHVFQETPHEPGGISVGNFIGCWINGGGNASAAVGCWSQL